MFLSYSYSDSYSCSCSCSCSCFYSYSCSYSAFFRYGVYTYSLSLRYNWVSILHCPLVYLLSLVSIDWVSTFARNLVSSSRHSFKVWEGRACVQRAWTACRYRVWERTMSVFDFV